MYQVLRSGVHVFTASSLVCCLRCFKIMFCRVYGFRVRVWESYRTSRSFGYEHGSVTELTEVPGIVARAYRTQKSSGWVQHILYPYFGYCGTDRTELTEIPGTGMKVLLNFRKFWVLWHGRTELTEVPGRYENAVPVSLVFVALAWRTYRSSGYGYEYPTELTEVPGTGKNPGEYTASGEEFNLKWSIPSSLHGMPSLG